jgi:hypothetical protein
MGSLIIAFSSPGKAPLSVQRWTIRSFSTEPLNWRSVRPSSRSHR